MINIYPASGRYHADHGWLKSDFSFSFAEYHDPDNVQFGPMRVLNDDIFAPETGFGMHPHREMEIVTLILGGQLEHRDSEGNRAVTSWGEVQRMSAGRGIYHSEMNPSDSEPVAVLQLWFLPKERGVKPSYETTAFHTEALADRLVPVVSHTVAEKERGKVAFINQDMTIYLSEPKEGAELQFVQEAGRKIFVFLVEGSIVLNGEATLGRRDSARIEQLSELTIKADTDSRMMIIDLP